MDLTPKKRNEMITFQEHSLSHSICIGLMRSKFKSFQFHYPPEKGTGSDESRSKGKCSRKRKSTEGKDIGLRRVRTTGMLGRVQTEVQSDI